MDRFHKKLIQRAIRKFVNIYPCSKATDFEESFTVTGNKLIFWFNTDDRSTHVVSSQIKNAIAHENLK